MIKSPKKTSVISAEHKSYMNLIERYKSRIEDLELSIDINRSNIKDLILSKFKEASNEASEKTLEYPYKKLESIIAENLKLENEVKQSLNCAKEAQSRSLIIQQIHYENNRKIDEIAQESEEKLKMLNSSICEKDRIIEVLKNTNAVLTQKLDSSIQQKNIPCVPPTSEILSSHIHIESIKDIIQDCARNCYMANNYRKVLSDFLQTLQTKCQFLQALLKNPINVKGPGCVLALNSLEGVEDMLSLSSSESSDGDVSEISRAQAFTKKVNRVPQIDFSKISNTKKPMKGSITLQVQSKNDLQESQAVNELKSLYFCISKKLTDSSSLLERTTQRNLALQLTNVELFNEIQACKKRITVEKSMIRRGVSLDTNMTRIIEEEEND